MIILKSTGRINDNTMLISFEQWQIVWELGKFHMMTSIAAIQCKLNHKKNPYFFISKCCMTY